LPRAVALVAADDDGSREAALALAPCPLVASGPALGAARNGSDGDDGGDGDPASAAAASAMVPKAKVYVLPVRVEDAGAALRGMMTTPTPESTATWPREAYARPPR
jgi:hypothetical protein